MVTDTIEQRGKIYGSYDEAAGARAAVMGVLKIHYEKNHVGKQMPEKLQAMFGDLAMKLVRASASPDHLDSFHDLAGYATLIEEALS